MNNPPLVCIIIVNWNGGKNIKNCLESLKLTSYGNYKVIVLDNNSTDNSIEIIKTFEDVILLEVNENLGFTKGSNLLYQYAIKKFNPDYICNMNNDIITVQSDWLDLMVEELEKEEKRGICGNKLVFEDNRLQLLYIERNLDNYTEKDNGQYDFVREVGGVGGANILFKRSVIDAIGGTDENFFFGPDDIDFCFRAKEKGYKIVYNGLSKSIHVGSFSYNTSSKNFIYKHQSYGMMVLCFRYGNGKKMIFNQLARVFVTRKNPYKKIKFSNIYFHMNIPKRLYYFITSLYKAILNYKKVEINNIIWND